MTAGAAKLTAMEASRSSVGSLPTVPIGLTLPALLM